MGDKVLLGKLAVGIAGLLLGLAILSRPTVFTTSARRFYAITWLWLVVSRLLVFVLLFGLLGFEAQSDVATVYYPQAKAALAGQVPYRDFASSYGPVFSHVAAAAVWIWDSPKSLILLSIFFEAAALPLWMRVASRAFDDYTARTAVIFYLTSALPIINVALDGQNQVWASFFLAAAVFLLMVNKWLWSGVAFSLSVIVVKFLPIVFLPAYLFNTRKRAAWLIGVAVLPIVVYGLMMVRGIDVLFPIKAEGADATSGNLPFLFGAISPHITGRVFIGLTVLALFAAYLEMFRRLQAGSSARATIFMIVVIQFALLIFSKKAYTNYLTMTLFPICLAIASDNAQSVIRRFLFFSGFGAIAVLEPSMWFRWLGREPLAVAWSNMASGGHSAVRLAIFLACDLVLLGFYVFYSLKSWRLCQGEFAAPGRLLAASER